MCVIPPATTTHQQEPDERNAERGEEREKNQN
jgi:O-acetylhomoserine/O-acetylserine sulfhydrylase-like pyridoxal-dependent enzyme